MGLFIDKTRVSNYTITITGGENNTGAPKMRNNFASTNIAIAIFYFYIASHKSCRSFTKERTIIVIIAIVGRATTLEREIQKRSKELTQKMKQRRLRSIN